MWKTLEKACTEIKLCEIYFTMSSVVISHHIRFAFSVVVTMQGCLCCALNTYANPLCYVMLCINPMVIRMSLSCHMKGNITENAVYTCVFLCMLYQNSVNLWRARLLLYIVYFTALHTLGSWLAVNAICCCWGDFYEWVCALHDASSASQETHSSKVYRIWL